MAEYIERGIAAKVACDAVWYGGGAPSVAEAINKVPAADVAPVAEGVRCRKAFALACRQLQATTGAEGEMVQAAIMEVVDREQVCRICGCTQNDACPGGCYWVEPDLCSACAGDPDG